MNKKDGALEPRKDTGDVGEKTAMDELVEAIKKTRSSDSKQPPTDESALKPPVNETIKTASSSNESDPDESKDSVPLTQDNGGASEKPVTQKFTDDNTKDTEPSSKTEAITSPASDGDDTRPKTVKPKAKSRTGSTTDDSEGSDNSNDDDRPAPEPLDPDEPITNARERYAQLTDTNRKKPDLGRETAILSTSNSRLRRVLSNRAPDGTTSLGDQREIIFVIRGMVERVILTDNLSVFLGRSEPGSRSQVDIDMTPYGALDRGVSRVHARLHLDDNKIYVTDLGSTNGTFLAGKRLEPNKPEPLRKGDELLLGRLAVQVLFR